MYKFNICCEPSETPIYILNVIHSDQIFLSLNRKALGICFHFFLLYLPPSSQVWGQGNNIWIKFTLTCFNTEHPQDCKVGGKFSSFIIRTFRSFHFSHCERVNKYWKTNVSWTKKPKQKHFSSLSQYLIKAHQAQLQLAFSVEI